MVSVSRTLAVHLDSKGISLKIAGCLAIVYVIWGSTYYAIRVSLESFPPLTMAGARFLAGGAILYAILRARGAPRPTVREWRASAIVGVLLLVVGNGAVVMAEQSVSSSFAALSITTVPLWAAGFSALLGMRPRGREWAGILVGFAGALILNLGGDLTTGGTLGLVILLAPVSWALGSVISRRLPLPKGGMATALEMLCAGVVLLPAGVLTGERLHGTPTPASIGAVVYLVIFGSLVALSAYTYLLENTRPAIATSYAYVNPIVAVLLGAGLGGETVGPSVLLGGAVVLLGVALISTAPRRA